MLDCLPDSTSMAAGARLKSFAGFLNAFEVYTSREHAANMIMMACPVGLIIYGQHSLPAPDASRSYCRDASHCGGVSS